MKNSNKLIMMAIIGSVMVLGSCQKKVSSVPVSGNTSTKVSSAEEENEMIVTYYGNEVSEGQTLKLTKGVKTAQLVVSGAQVNPSFVSSNTSALLIDTYSGLLTPVAAGVSTVTVTAGEETLSVNFEVEDASLATGIQSYSTASYEEKAKILAALEDYAVDNYLTGITMFSNGSYVCYNSRYVPAAREYVAGYGWGTKREGKLNGTLPRAAKHPDYYQVGTSALPLSANAMDASGSDVSDLASYLTSSYFSTRLNATGDGYEWYPELAVADQARPIAIGEDEKPNNASLNKRWRIYVRTGDDAPKYALGISEGKASDPTITARRAQFNGRKIELEDYLTPFKFMLTNYNGQYRGTELTDGLSGFAGAAGYFGKTSVLPADPKTEFYNETLWDEYMTKPKNLFVGTDEKGSYIEFNLLYPCTQFYAMYYLASSLYSPIPADFIKIYGTSYGENTTDGCTFVDTTIAVGPYYIEEWESGQYYCLTRNPGYHITSETLSDGTTRQLYQIPGFLWRKISSKNSELQKHFLNAEIDSYSPDKDALKGDFASDDGVGTDMRWHRYKTKADANFKINVNATTEQQWIKNFGPNGSVYPHGSSEKGYSDYVPFYLSNKHFLNFLSYGLDRKTICESRGMTPTQEYLSDNYLIDPENSVSYNSTAAHKAVLADRYNDSYGYNVEAATSEFAQVMEEVIVPNRKKLKTEKNTGAAGTPANPYMITVDMNWMNETDEDTYGDVFDSIKKIANDYLNLAYGGSYKFDVNQIKGSADYQQVYNKMKQGEFALGFGAISGNDLNPLQFFEVLKSDNSSSFTLNWGPDTSEVSDDIVYDGKKWSYDSLWSAGNSAVALDNAGNIAKLENVSLVSKGSAKYTSMDASTQTVVYTVSFEALIQAGAKIEELQLSNDAATKSLDVSSLSSTNVRLDIPVGAGDNEGTNFSDGDLRQAVLTVTYSINDENHTQLTGTLKLLTYYGINNQ